MTENLKAFLAANERSPVVSGAVIGRGGEGGIYTLQDGKTFTLSRDERLSTPVPRWLGVP